jgi:gas vesicle protein
MCEKREHLVGMSVSFIVGAALGAGLALLFAPASGDETRKRIKQTGEKYFEQGKEKVNEVISKAKGRFAKEEGPAEA